MSRLTASISETQGYIAQPLEPGFYLLDSEVIFVKPDPDPLGVLIDRALGGTSAGPHAAGARLTVAEDPAIGGGDGGQTADVQAALDGANNPSAGNVFATLADVPGGAFTPASLSGLALWLDASDATTINAGSPSDDDPVSLWADKSGNGYDAAQATADNRPVYKVSVLNGLSVVRFDPSENPQFVGLTGDGLSMLAGAEGVTIAAALIMDPGDLSVGCPFGADTQAGGGYRAEMQGVSGYFTNTNNGDYMAVNGTFDNAVSGHVTRPVSALVVYNYLTVSGHTLCSNPQYVNLLDPPGLTQSGGPVPSTPSDSVTVGKATDGAFTGDIGELVVYARALGQSEQRRVLEYLCDKWGTL